MDRKSFLIVCSVVAVVILVAYMSSRKQVILDSNRPPPSTAGQSETLSKYKFYANVNVPDSGTLSLLTQYAHQPEKLAEACSQNLACIGFISKTGELKQHLSDSKFWIVDNLTDGRHDEGLYLKYSSLKQIV